LRNFVSGMATLKSKLSLDSTREMFFEDTSLIGFVCPVPPYKMCWLVNRYFDLEFEREADGLISQARKNQEFYYPYYIFNIITEQVMYRLYSVKSGKEPLLTDYKEFDFLWLVQSSDSWDKANQIAGRLKKIPEVVLTHVLLPDDLKNALNLLV
jgi:hypothetical protein